MTVRAPVDSRHTILLGRAVTKIRRRLAAYHQRPPALTHRHNVPITLPAEQWEALLRQVER